ncbi:MAG: transcription termination factor Rho [Phycisphaerales bacterium]|nr:transcription termination factor Rho [Planctomycetota bacterium]MCH8508145.1 transcription termination factor Rho [Phycisphaerales bacterium]
MSTKTLTGILEWPERAEGRVRQMADTNRVLQAPDDPFVPASFGETLPLRDGLRVEVEVGEHKPRRRRRGRSGAPRKPRPVVERFIEIEGMPPEEFAKRKPFEELTSIDPQPRLTLEHPGCAPSCRLIDLFCPIGRGQRGLIVAPPKAGKTTLLKDIATGILVNHPDVRVIALLVDERPEEVTDFRRFLCGTADQREGKAAWDKPWKAEAVEVIASSNDHDIDKHIQICLQTLERCKRMVENGEHIVVVLDSLTRVGRAFNRSNRHANSGRTMSGGIDSKALDIPKQIFGAARNTEEAGSLTMIATCLVDTGSQGDQLIFEEFKGTGNMELILDRKISEKRLFPAINLAASGTRKEELLLDPQAVKTITALRRRMLQMPPHVQVEQLLTAMKRFETNDKLVGSAG